MGDALERVLYGVREVVHGIDAPRVARAVVVHTVDAVDNGVAHVEVARREVDFGAERHAAVGELARAHTAEQVEAFLNGTVAERADGGGARVAAVFAHLFGRQLADVGETLLDQLHREAVHLLKILGGVEEAVAPVKAEPVNVLPDGVNVLHVLFGGIGVVHAEVADAVVFFGGGEVDADRLGVADVQIAVRLGRKTGVYGFALVAAALGNVLVDKGVDKIALCYFIVD